MASTDYSAPFTLYYGYYSVFSTMVRLTFALRGAPRPDRPEMTLHKQPISISPAEPEQLSEEYMTKINPKGQVPVLANEVLLGPKPMPESADIAYYMSEWYPSLLPKEHEATIRELVGEVYKISMPVLTFPLDTKNPAKFMDKVKELLAKPDLSDTHRQALEAKAKFLENAPKIFSQANLDVNIERVKDFSAKILAVREKNGTGDTVDYIFGTTPTILDADVLTFFARMCDAGRKDLIPAPLVKWVEHFREGPVWKEVVPGYTTFPAYA
ncbi:hypothetical protein M406DRAFT_355772 [Cryphonectria parasitica EP155]|uniref:GST N-terminal domain-containing protein n=1 Tax=Cryphonectria parasitica (strain ATCC 38755 / EP155) TaxID=660469 RepID=A0A9P5CSA3_CRYP1|nr:uncharacterized protein M406DRAFT_355772 [Cryphonectria parasitica EP155]KAF3767945.1 hypothetical protein M406DRAFT_355772 [Cryphonectria parasitica EP155]